MVRVALAVILALAVSSCGSDGAKPVVVASKNFTEQLVLGEIIAQHLERRGMRVDRKLNLGGTLLAHQALVSGGIDLYPEYTGTALTAVLRAPPEGDASAVWKQVSTGYLAKWQIEWMRPLGFDNTFAMAVRADSPYRTLSEAAAGEAWRMGVGYEFLQRPDGLPGLMRTYGLKLARDPISMDLGLLYRALETRQVDMAAASSTDAQLSTGAFRVLEDDRRYFPPYECSIVARRQALESRPGLREALAALSGRIDASAMRRLNHEAEGKKRPIVEIAREFVASL